MYCPYNCLPTNPYATGGFRCVRCHKHFDFDRRCMTYSAVINIPACSNKQGRANRTLYGSRRAKLPILWPYDSINKPYHGHGTGHKLYLILFHQYAAKELFPVLCGATMAKQNPAPRVLGAGLSLLFDVVIVVATGLCPTHAVQHLTELSTGDGSVGVEGALVINAAEHAEVPSTQEVSLACGDQAGHGCGWAEGAPYPSGRHSRQSTGEFYRCRGIRQWKYGSRCPC